MAQVTIYLDDATARLARAAARAAELSQSRWLAILIRERPAAVREAAASWPDFPDAETIREGPGRDLEREDL